MIKIMQEIEMILIVSLETIKIHEYLREVSAQKDNMKALTNITLKKSLMGYKWVHKIVVKHMVIDLSELIKSMLGIIILTVNNRPTNT